MDVVGVMAAYYCAKLSDDGSLVIRDMLEHFNFFLNIL